ncbi:MAG TPA: hypothetical protein VHT91_42875 [Kofleriaceae bacterium]|nr:hypothetical protein [Kofleriaceae bacterium]
MDLELLEALALSGDRSAALAQLLPGSEDHDYYRALDAQHRGALDEAEAVLQSWPERHGHTPGYDRLHARQLLYRVTASPPEAVDQVRDWLGVSHWHEADAEIRIEDVHPSRPSRLPERAFDPVALLRQAAEADANLAQVTEEGIAELVEWQLEPARRRVVLGRLGHTPQPEVVRLVADELAQRNSGGFGALAIHRELTLDQLHELAQLRPELRGHAGWVAAVVTRMRPAAAVDLDLDRDARAAYLDELWRFVADLPPASNSLKAHVLWHVLDTARRRGVGADGEIERSETGGGDPDGSAGGAGGSAPRGIDEERFRSYLALPRAARFLARGRVDRVRRDEVAELGADFTQITGLGPAGDDEELVRDVVQRELDAAEAYAPWLDRGWLDAELAAARLLAGAPDADRATLVLGPARAAALRDRIELAFSPHNPAWFAAGAPVALDVEVKHVAELVVKVFRIDPLAYFHHHRREVDTGLDLDGLAASAEHVLRFTEPPVRRVRRRIELPACARPGSYVIDLIGNGMSSRAVIHKGRLRHATRVGAAGHVITILDDAGRPQPGARAWIGDREYVADERGAVVVPFSTSPARTAMLLAAGDVASVAYVDLVAETAELELRLVLDHQGLTAGRTARAIARLGLKIGTAPASLALLRQASWDVALTDRHGVSTTRSQPLELAGDDAAVLEWPLGDDTAEIALTVRGRVEIRSEQREREIRTSRSLGVGSMYAGTGTEAVYLARTATGWVVSALGRTGEPRAHRPVSVGITHRWARTQLTAELATDERGRIELGELPGARRITATLGGATQSWELDDPPPPPAALHATAGCDVIVPVPASRTPDDVLRRASLVELRAGVPARHPQVEVELLAGALAIRGLGPGNYQLRAHGLGPTPIIVTATPAQDGEVAGWAVGEGELVQVPRPAPAIARIELGERLTVQLRGGDARTRVHLIATRFAPAPVEPLGEGPAVSAHARLDPRTAARYVSGRELGDEYRYVLERRSQPRFPGLLLDRPSLLLNPWARRTTTTDVAEARAGGAFSASPRAGRPMGHSGRTQDMVLDRGGHLTVGYDFLAAPPVVIANLVPDDTGAIAVALAELGAAAAVSVIVDDPAGVAVRRIALAEPPLATRDLRLQIALDPDRHATQRKQIVALVAGTELVIDDLATARLHLIDSVERAHAYLLALRDDADLREFGFVTRWRALADAERRALYSKYACHELHLFLYFRDRAFFDAVLRPYLAHKRVKTFVDHWLLDADLTPYTEPARLERLNAFERALLARRVAAGPAIARLLGDEVAALPPDPGRDARLLDALLGGATLDADADIAEARQMADVKGEAEYDDEAFTEAEVTGLLPDEPVRAMAAMSAAMAAPSPRPAPGPALPGKHLVRRASRDTSAEELERDVARRTEAAPMFRAADQAQEWAEHNWWHRTPAHSGADLIGPSRLWRDLADHTTGPFLSPALGLATGSFAEAMCALAVTDLPFVAPRHAITSDGPRLTIAAAGNALAGSSQLAFGELVSGGAPLVVGMSYVRADDRHDWSSGEPVDKYVDGPLATGVVYTCQVVLANPTSARQRVAALVQIPRGSIALAGARPTHTIDALLEPYGTHGHEVSFYFPAPGRWSHFPVHVSRGGQIVAAAPGRHLEVRTDAAPPDARSWPALSQRGALDDVVAHLAAANLATIDVARVAWRLRDRAAYDAILGALEARCAFDAALWGYALLHRDPPRIRTWLRARAADLAAAGPVLDMIDVDAEATGSYEHLELAPLINARAHRLGAKVRILNDGLAAQYTGFLDLVAHRRAPTPDDLLAATHYLLAQDRVPAALAALARINPAAIASRMQHDYLAAYAACLTGELGHARELATRWRDHPVDRWRVRFAALAAMLDEVDGAAPEVTDARSRDQQHAELAARQPTFDLAVDRDGVVVHSQHVAALELRFFEMDIELLFSRQPFMQSDVSRLSYIEPAHREAIADPPAEHRVAWPAPLRGKNVVVEAVGAGLRKARVHHANDLVTTLSHQYGRLRVQRASSRTALAATYVKVYARQRGGQVAFYKDGYTDLRGWFDYASLSTTELDAVDRFAILVCSDHAGAAILEASPPAR